MTTRFLAIMLGAFYLVVAGSADAQGSFAAFWRTFQIAATKRRSPG